MSVAIIGGSDGPTSIFILKRKKRKKPFCLVKTVKGNKKMPISMLIAGAIVFVGLFVGLAAMVIKKNK